MRRTVATADLAPQPFPARGLPQATPQAGAVAQPAEAEDPEQDKIEIPAFLRRQAN